MLRTLNEADDVIALFRNGRLAEELVEKTLSGAGDTRMEEKLREAANRCEGYRLKGYHCSESALRACAEALGVDLPETLLKVSSGFRGGGGGYGERCGVVEAGIILISYIYGRLHPTESKAPYSYLIRLLHDRFLEEMGSYTCRVLKPFAYHISPDNSCSYTYKKGAIIITKLLLEAERLIAEMPPEEAEK